MASTKTAGKFSESFPRTSCLPGALAGITSSGMKTVTVEQAQPPLPDPLRLVARGPETRVMRRKRALARIVPADRGLDQHLVEGGRNIPRQTGAGKAGQPSPH